MRQRNDAIAVQNKQSPREEIKDQLARDLNTIVEEPVGYEMVYGNSRGINLLHDHEDLRERMARMEARLDAQELKNKTQELKNKTQDAKIMSLENRVKHLSTSSKGYMVIRRRFLTTYKRDREGRYDLRGSKAIRDGDARAHHGDAVADAYLFLNDKRTDASTYRTLYGLEFDQVVRYSEVNKDEGVWLVLNDHASKVAAGKVLSDSLKSAFATFITELKNSWPDEPQTDLQSPLTIAYHRYWAICNSPAALVQDAT